MLLTDLPLDILTLIPEHFESLDDLHAIILTSRVLYFANSSPTPSRIQRLATSPHSGIQPYPHLFIAVKARVLADWAVQSSANRESLLTAITTGGPQGVLDLALSISPLTLADLIFLRTTRLTVLDPAIAILDPICRGATDGADDLIVCHDIPLSIINYWIYCDLFYHAIAASALCRAARVPAPMPLSKDTRLKWVHHFLRDCDESHGFGELGDVWLLDTVYLVNDGLRGIIAAQLADITFAQYSAKSMFIRRASHMGLASLKLVTFHAEAMSAGPERIPDEIKALAAAVKSLKDYKPGTAYLGSDVIGYDPEDNTVIIWGSLLVDIDNLLHHS